MPLIKSLNNPQIIFLIAVDRKIDTKSLMTFKNYGDMKFMSRQRVYKLVKANKLDSVDIDGVKFIVMNEKAIKYKKQI